jgi:hypothetical protein
MCKTITLRNNYPLKITIYILKLFENIVVRNSCEIKNNFNRTREKPSN